MKKKLTPSVSWEILALLLLLLFMHGVYAADQFVAVGLGISVMLLVTILYKLITKSSAIQLNWISVACFTIGLSYSLTFFNTVSLEMSALKMMEWITYGLIFLWLPKFSSTIVHNSIIIFNSVFVLMHLLLLVGAFGNEANFLYANEGLSISGIRLDGWFQYANATGAIAATLWFYTLQISKIPTSLRFVESISLVGLPFLLLLTESRGALLSVMIATIIAIIIRRDTHRGFWTRFIFSGCTAIIAYSAIIGIGSNRVGYVVAMLMGIAASFLWMKRQRVTQLAQSKVKAIQFVLVSIFFVFMMLLGVLKADTIMHRFSLATLFDRWVYIQDAWKAISSSWVIGYGGEAWSFVQYSYQSAPYIVNDLHMFYIQHWLETGMIGFVILLLSLCFGLYYMVKRKRTLILPTIVLLSHACIDFTLSYSFSIVLLLMFFYEALGENNYISCPPIWSYISGILLTTILCFLAFCWQQAESSYKLYAESAHEQALDKAISLNPFATKYYLAKIHEHSSLQEDMVYYEKILQMEPYSAHIHLYLAEAYESIDNAKAIQHIELSLTYDKFDRIKYERAFDVLTDIRTNEAHQLKERLQQQLNELLNSERATIVQDQRDFFALQK